MGFADNLRKLRIEMGLSQKKLADMIGVSQTAIYNWERGARNPKIEQLLKISEALHCEVSELDENIIVNNFKIKFEPTPEEIERYKKDAEARRIIEKQKSGEQITEEEKEIISDYTKRISENFSKRPERIKRMKELQGRVDKIGENILLTDYRELNTEGQSEARKRVAELTEIPRYTKPDGPPGE